MYPKLPGTLWHPHGAADLKELFASGASLTPRGNARSYGDAALGKRLVSGLALEPVFELDKATGTLRCSAGLLLDEVLLRVVPEGFFLPVTPGTRLVSIGGAIAADIHGKNHHVDGGFCAFVQRMRIVIGSGEVVECSPTEQPELFWATCGGMGLTGFILQATIRLKPITSSYIRQLSIKCHDLDELFTAFEKHREATYSVAWVDLTAKGRHQGRSILLLGEHARASELGKRQARKPLKPHGKPLLKVPFFFPEFVLSAFTVKVFNWFYYLAAGVSGKTSLVHYAPYFHPLDAVSEWNRIYGRRGFIQYQFVVPLESGRNVMGRILGELREHGMVSFLSVLKRFGPGSSEAMLSFPMEGYTLALDIPIRDGIMTVLDELDELVAAAGGRIYLVKDARTSARMLAQGYPGLGRFREAVAKYGQGRFSSALAERIGLTPRSGPSVGFDPKTVLILGAGSGMASKLAFEFARAGHPLVLALRNTQAGEALAAALREGTGASSRVVHFDAVATDTHAAFYAALDPRPGVVVCAFGLLPDQGTAEAEPGGGLAAIAVNFTGAVSILEEAARDLEARGQGSIIGISSVAGDRGRASNYFYGSAKAGFTAYLSGLRNRLHPSGVHVLTVKPGFVRTTMTEGLPLPKPLTASAEQAAHKIFRAYGKRRNTVYVLGRWRWVMLIIRSIPEGVFKRMKL